MKTPIIFLFIAIPIIFHPNEGLSVQDETCIEEAKENLDCDVSRSPENPRKKIAENIEKQEKLHNDICVNNPCILITGDTQYPRTPDKKINQKDKAAKQLEEYFENINIFSEKKGENFKGIIINGDITEYGHPHERDFMQNVFDIVEKPIWFGLGNHDYLNNANDCFMNRCVSSSLEWLVDEVINRYKNIISYDYLIKDINEFPTIVREYVGSFAYAYEIAGIRFIQLNHTDDYTYKMERAFNAGMGKTTSVHIQPSKKWVRKQLEEAYKDNIPVILLSHTHSLSNYLIANSIRNNVSAHYFGHWHGDPKILSKKIEYFGGDKFLSGTAHQGSGLIVEIDQDNNVLYNYAFYNNDMENFTLIATTALHKRKTKK